MTTVLHYYSFYPLFFLVVFLLTLFPSSFSIYVNTLSSTEFLTPSSNRTIVSLGDVFELGFFKIVSSSSGDDRWYLGIWYKKELERIYVWVANRNKPLFNTTGTLKIAYNNLLLLDQDDNLVWSTNLTRRNVKYPLVAELLANGNFVLRYSSKNDPDGFLWQSFDFPTDTLLPEMKLGWDLKTGFNRYLTSWTSVDDPSSGNFSYKLVTQGFPEFLLVALSEFLVYRSGPWNGIQFSGITDTQQVKYTGYNLTQSKEEVTYTFLVTNQSLYSRVTLHPQGYMEGFTWIPTELNPDLYWYSPKEPCDGYQKCGRYSYCDFITSFCICIRGFVPKNLEKWELRDASSGCVRKTRLSCGRDGFWRLTNMKLPEARMTIVDRSIGSEECEKMCSKYCNCTAFGNMDIRNGGSGCVIWTGELLDLRNYVIGGQDLYVKLADADLGEDRNIKKKIIGLVIGVIVIILLSSFVILFIWKRKRKLTRAVTAPNVISERGEDVLMDGLVLPEALFSRDNITDDLELPSTDFQIVARATNNFSDANKLGEGGFGCVYKGSLLNGQEFAVKRLSVLSRQGTDEFKNEVKVISRLQHVNLVRILGCCAHAKEKMLIYEYLENSSLDRYIFDKCQRSKLNWQRRFEITNGIARGILYLHHDSRCRVIHRDLKASNILLDKNMIPKISDFGMARIFADDEQEAITRRIVGTYGYMSPEYAMDGVYSEKSDVFSFGVLLLEIVSGKKNRGFFNSDLDSNLLSYVWRNMEEGKELEVPDPYIIDSSSSSPRFRPDEVLRCIKIALLCVQEHAEDRPTMLSVVSMLVSESMEIRKAKAPGYCVGRSPYDTSSSSSSSSSSTFTLTLSDIEPR